MTERADAPDMTSDIEWLHRFLNCTVFGPPVSEIQRAHGIVQALTARVSEIEAKQDAERMAAGFGEALALTEEAVGGTPPNRGQT